MHDLLEELDVAAVELICGVAAVHGSELQGSSFYEPESHAYGISRCGEADALEFFAAAFPLYGFVGAFFFHADDEFYFLGASPVFVGVVGDVVDGDLLVIIVEVAVGVPGVYVCLIALFMVPVAVVHVGTSMLKGRQGEKGWDALVNPGV